MRVIFALLLTAMVTYTVWVEETELLITKLSLRCMLYIFTVFSIDLWLRGMGWMGSIAHLAAIVLILCTNDTEPNSAAPLLLFYESIAIVAFLRCYNPQKHVRQLTPPFNVVGELPEDGPLIPNIFQEVVDFSSNSEDDEDVEHWPPGLQFLNGEDFLLGPLPHNTAPAG